MRKMSSFLLLCVPLSCISTPYRDNEDVEIVEDIEMLVFLFFFSPYLQLKVRVLCKCYMQTASIT